VADEPHLITTAEMVETLSAQTTNCGNAPADLRERGASVRPPLLTATDLEKMTPDERDAAFDQRLVTNWNDVPEGLRAKIAAAPAPAHVTEA
jgi:hypothetical protein